MPTQYPREDFTTRQLARMLTASKAMRCPGRNPQCKCSDCTGRPAVTLRVQTFTDPRTPDVTEPACDHGMLGTCTSCVAERAAAIARGPRDVTQPWEIRRAA